MDHSPLGILVRVALDSGVKLQRPKVNAYLLQWVMPPEDKDAFTRAFLIASKNLATELLYVCAWTLTALIHVFCGIVEAAVLLALYSL